MPALLANLLWCKNCSDVVLTSTTTLSACHLHCSKPHQGAIMRYVCYCLKRETAPNICLRQPILLQTMGTTMSQYSSSRTLSCTQRVVCHCCATGHQQNQHQSTV